MKKEFNVAAWIEPAIQKTEPPSPDASKYQTEITASTNSDFENLLSEIESRQVDITTSYQNWRDIGFALADNFQEKGREYFHRISKFHPAYTAAECDSQYTNCLKSKGQGITLKTIFYLAKQAGINSFTPLHFGEGSGVGPPLPNFPDTIYPQLPLFMQNVVARASTSEEKDLMLLGALVSISACFPTLFGIYDGKKVAANLFLYITAQASAGKGRLVHCKQIVKPVHRFKREQAKMLRQQFDLEMLDYNDKKGKDTVAQKPQKPPDRMLIIPANSSSTGVFQLLFENEGSGLIFETEGDTLAQIFKTDYGNYSEGFRKAFHHETISYYRRTDREYVEIENPCLSAVLSGTPKQVASLIPNAENGLFSRFIFYFMKVNQGWKNVFADNSGNGLDDYFDSLGHSFFRFYEDLLLVKELRFCLTTNQQEQFNRFFENINSKYLSLKGIEYMATIRRLGLIAYRIAMILSTLRLMETGDFSGTIICEDKDFNTSLEMITVLIQHAAKVFSELPEDTPLPRRNNQKEKFLESLPPTFNRQAYLQVAASLNIPDKTAEAYITDFYKKSLLNRPKQDYYEKPGGVASVSAEKND